MAGASQAESAPVIPGMTEETVSSSAGIVQRTSLAEDTHKPWVIAWVAEAVGIEFSRLVAQTEAKVQDIKTAVEGAALEMGR